jgi:hypothetical protein
MAVETARHDEIDRMLGGLVGPALTDLAAQLRRVRRLGSGEHGAVVNGVARVLRALVWRHVRRVVLVELHAARLSGQLTAGDPRARWQEWVETLAAPGAWKKLTAPYPDLLPRLRVLIGNRGTGGIVGSGPGPGRAGTVASIHTPVSRYTAGIHRRCAQWWPGAQACAPV